MLLIEDRVFLKEIMLDILNPRFGKRMDYSQYELISYLQKGEKSKELLTSMRSQLSWVNKIVIVPIEDLSEEEKSIYRSYNENFMSEYKYVVVEGNTRIACLHHDSMRETFDVNELLPVIIVKRSADEDDKKFIQERKRLQSISNVMVVKEWGDIPKAKQLFDSYKLIQEINQEKSEKQIIRELSDTLGLKTTLVKNFVYRYAFYQELIENVQFMEEKDFKFLEGLHQNITIQNMFGLDNKKMEFEWNIIEDDDENITELIEKKQQLLYMFPKLIEIAKDEKINSKSLRDILREHQGDGVEYLCQKVKDIIEYSETDDYSNDGFSRTLPKEYTIEDEEKKLKSNLSNILKILKNFPVNQDYSQNFKNDMTKIRDVSTKILAIMDMDIWRNLKF